MVREVRTQGPNLMTPGDIFYRPARYEVPDFQRSYIWNQDDQWEPLWEDVTAKAATLIETGATTFHFMGAIALQQQMNSTGSIESRIVVDGQQRLTTLQLLIHAIKEVCEQHGYTTPAERLLPLVHTPEAFWGGNPDFAFKVWPSIYDQPAFRHAMKKASSGEQYERSNIVMAHNYFKNKAEQWLDVFPDEDDQRRKAADALVDVVSGRLEMVVIDLRQIDDPHVIFETLNARGTPLLPSDMIKNQILHRAGIGPNDGDEPTPPQASKLWGFNEDWWRLETGRGNQRRPRIDVYLNNWLTLRNKSETKNYDEFRVFSKYADEAEAEGKGSTIEEIAADILNLGEIYKNIEQNTITDMEPFLHRRQVIGIGGIIPVLLWLLSNEVPTPQRNKSFTALESYIVRRMVCGMGARSYGHFFAGLVSELETGGKQDAGNTVVRYLAQQTAYANLWPDDQSLLDKFLTEPLYWSMTAGRLNLILQGIEGELRTKMSETQTVPHNLHIEHIMPQGWPQNWPLPDDTADKEKATEDRNRLIHSIGNLTLVNQQLNTALSNEPWEQKLETIRKHSVLFLNKNLTDNAQPQWDESTVADRAKSLHQEAVKVWPHAGSIN